MGRRYLHGLQVVAVGLFIGLLLSFYILLLPFLGQVTAQASFSTFYSIAAVALVYLYIACVIADNGDSGVKKRQEEDLRQACSPTPLVGGPPTSSFNYESDPLFPSKEDPKSHELRSPFSEACGYTTLSLEEDPNDVTVCFLCNKKVLRSSKHCRSCDKCVMGFDHHCRWLNNCVGKKNYNYFVALMAVCLSLLFMEGGVGVMVITRCFTQGDMMALRIHQKLGLSRGCLISLAVLISVASFSALAAVGELLLFHLLLIKKGLSTYEFVLASKELNAEHIDVDNEDFNRKGDSNLASNLLLCRRRGSFFYGGWCTTHRVFLDPEYQQDDTMHIAHQKMSSADFSKEIASPVTIKAKPKPKPVKVNIWHLMRLNAHEARRALERRSSSSSPYTAKSPSTTGRSSTSTSFNNKNKMDLQPLPVEARCGFRDQFHSILPPSTTQMRSIIEEEEGVLSSSSSMSSYFDSDNYYSEEAEEGSDRGLRQQQQQLSKDSSSTPIDKILINDSSIFFSGPLTVEREGDLFH